jgi:lipopolysaccharide/colanic/teichoic acid biosynthesis glycosyltransferase
VTRYDDAKRVFDVVVAGSLLILLSPAIAAIAMAVRLGMGRPVLFRQRRPGLHARPFTIYKFRTMRELRDPKGELLPDGDRLTSLGEALRSASVDELPELWNVLRGDMSLVGPRPLLMRYLDRYSAEQARRHEVRPGITGLAQVSGRNGIDWERKLALDVWYVDHRSFRLDLKILLRTAGLVLRRVGIRQPGTATVEEFTGSP